MGDVVVVERERHTHGQQRPREKERESCVHRDTLEAAEAG